MKCEPMGSPAVLQCRGTVMAGNPVKLATGVNGTYRARSSSNSSNGGPGRTLPDLLGRSPSVAESSTSWAKRNVARAKLASWRTVVATRTCAGGEAEPTLDEQPR